METLTLAVTAVCAVVLILWLFGVKEYGIFGTSGLFNLAALLAFMFLAFRVYCIFQGANN